MIGVTPHPRGAVLPVRAKPGARRDAIIDEHGGALRVAVAAPPEDGKANDAIVRLLAEVFCRRRSTVHLIAGQTSRTKKILFEDITPAALNVLLAELLAAQNPTSSVPEHGPRPHA